MTGETSELVAHISAGMDLCTSDFTKWGVVDAVVDSGPEGAVVVGRVDETGREVYVPAGAILEIHGECVRLDARRATIDAQGWDRRPSRVP